eukprot:TRINITY_DN5690_c0_g1_i2.p1 TRINITY_DN5690_c0_g1~~TRINITY_DN5690_c0_g1_i2.p1  ORF type:complete len:336 (-),score=78.63 TRINITY_DN5690_c0_g1_i2:144-1151(-)
MAESKNFAFCTINPNIGKVACPDARLDNIAKIIKPNKIVYPFATFVDIAGLIEGASDGVGLGNQFLSSVERVAVIMHVVRCFDLPNIQHVYNETDPIRDIKIIRSELIQKDLQKLVGLRKGGKNLNLDIKNINDHRKLVDQVTDFLKECKETGTNVATKLDPLLKAKIEPFNLISIKPVLHILNIDEDSIPNGNEYTKSAKEWLDAENSASIDLCVKLEKDIQDLEPVDKKEIMDFYGLEDSKISDMIQKTFVLRGTQVYYTFGKTEARAWEIPRGYTAKECAGKIHSDLKEGFIRAKLWDYEQFVASKGKLKETVVRGDYVAKDGDMFEFVSKI